MDRKNMALILSIFLFVGLLFSVNYLERQQEYKYDEQHQMYSVSAGTAGGSIMKMNRRVEPLPICFLFLPRGILCRGTEKWIELYLKRIEMLHFLKEIRISQKMDGKKRKSVAVTIE